MQILTKNRNSVILATITVLTAVLVTGTFMVSESYAGENGAPTCKDRFGNTPPADIYKEFPDTDASNTWVTTSGVVTFDRWDKNGINGIEANEGWIVKGTKLSDVIVGSHLDDLIKAGKGADIVCADDPRVTNSIGDDEVRGGKGSDDLWGTYIGVTIVTSDTDLIQGGFGDDWMWGQDGPDTLLGGHGKDNHICSNGGPDGDKDTVEGGHDDDTATNCLETTPDFDDVDLGKDD